VAQLREMLYVLDMTLSAAERKACDAVSPLGNTLTGFHNSSGLMKATAVSRSRKESICREYKS